MTTYKIVLIPGDGIGPEITDAVREVFSAAHVPIEWLIAQAGMCAVCSGGNGLPNETIEMIKSSRVALKGPTTTPSGSGHQSINVLLRKKLGLFANLRPVRSLPGIKTRFGAVNSVIVRENIEDTYGGQEYMHSAGVVQGIKLISSLGSERCIRFAFEFALHSGRSKIVCVHKANIHKMADGMFLRVFNEVKAEYPRIIASDILVDNLCMQLVTAPERFEVMVTPNLYGDIISDLCAGLVGGLGVAPSANIGKGIAVFEAVHGSAPDIAGKGIANPTAILLSSLMMLRYLGLHDFAVRIECALLAALDSGQRTADLGGALSTKEFAQVVIRNLAANGGAISAEAGALRSFSPLEQISHRISGVQAETVGIDVVVKSSVLPEPPLQVGSLRLHGVANRGIKTGGDSLSVDNTDVYCIRYLSDGILSDTQIREVVHTIESAGLNWVQLQKLLRYNGVNGFSEML